MTLSNQFKTNKIDFRTKRQEFVTNFIKSMTLLKKVKTNKSSSMTNKIVLRTKMQRVMTVLIKSMTKIVYLRTKFKTIRASV